jgi:hypothetical protein
MSTLRIEVYVHVPIRDHADFPEQDSLPSDNIVSARYLMCSHLKISIRSLEAELELVSIKYQ